MPSTSASASSCCAFISWLCICGRRLRAAAACQAGHQAPRDPPVRAAPVPAGGGAALDSPSLRPPPRQDTAVRRGGRCAARCGYPERRCGQAHAARPATGHVAVLDDPTAELPLDEVQSRLPAGSTWPGRVRARAAGTGAAVSAGSSSGSQPRRGPPSWAAGRRPRPGGVRAGLRPRRRRSRLRRLDRPAPRRDRAGRAAAASRRQARGGAAAAGPAARAGRARAAGVRATALICGVIPNMSAGPGREPCRSRCSRSPWRRPPGRSARVRTPSARDSTVALLSSIQATLRSRRTASRTSGHRDRSASASAGRRTAAAAGGARGRAGPRSRPAVARARRGQAHPDGGRRRRRRGRLRAAGRGAPPGCPPARAGRGHRGGRRGRRCRGRRAGAAGRSGPRRRRRRPGPGAAGRGIPAAAPAGPGGPAARSPRGRPLRRRGGRSAAGPRQQHLGAHQLQQQPRRGRAAHLDQAGADDLRRPGQLGLAEARRPARRISSSRSAGTSISPVRPRPAPRPAR